MWKQIVDARPETYFLVLALVFGLLFLVYTPPYQVPDEPSHFFKAYAIGEGHILPEIEDGHPVIRIPQNMLLSVLWYSWMPLNPDSKHFYGSTLTNLRAPLDPDITLIVADTPTVFYPPIAYIAPGMTMGLAKLFEASPLLLMYLGRLANLLVWIFLVYLAIKNIPVHKWVLFLLALMPMSIYLGSSLSADSFTMALSFFYIAFFLKLALDDEKESIENRDILIMIGLSILLALSKVGYLVLLGLFLLIPKEKFGSRNQMAGKYALLFTPVAIVTLLWNFLVQSVATASQKAYAQGKMVLITSDPSFFPQLLSCSIGNCWNHYLTSFVGTFGWTENPLPAAMVYIYLAVLVLVALLDNSKIKIGFKQKVIPLIIFIILSLSTFIYMYFVFTPSDGGFINGVQGRYFIPVAPLFFLLFYNQNLRSKFKILQGRDVYLKFIIILFSVLFSLVSLFLLIKRYY